MKKLMIAAVTVGGLFAAPSANADVITYKINGTVSTASDPYSLFGGVAVGDSASVVYTFDTALGTVFTAPSYFLYEGGSIYGTPLGAVGSLTINSHTYSDFNRFPARTGATVGHNQGSHIAFDLLSLRTDPMAGGGIFGYVDLGGTVTTPTVPPVLGDPFVFSGIFGVSFTSEILNCVATCFSEGLEQINITGTSFSSTRVPSVSTVPEPLTLSVFGAGLAGMASLRRRRNANAA